MLIETRMTEQFLYPPRRVFAPRGFIVEHLILFTVRIPALRNQCTCQRVGATGECCTGVHYLTGNSVFAEKT